MSPVSFGSSTDAPLRSTRSSPPTVIPRAASARGICSCFYGCPTPSEGWVRFALSVEGCSAGRPGAQCGNARTKSRRGGDPEPFGSLASPRSLPPVSSQPSPPPPLRWRTSRGICFCLFFCPAMVCPATSMKASAICPPQTPSPARPPDFPSVSSVLSAACDSLRAALPRESTPPRS